MISGKDNRNSFLLLLVPMLFVGLILQIIHLPEVVSLNRPDFLTLIILFFSIYSNFSLKIEVSWLVGIFLDLATGAPLGINALIISAQIYLITTQFKNFYKYRLWQQVIIVGIINFLVTILCYWIEHIIGRSYYEINFLIPSVSTAVFWPIVYWICLILCSTFSVASDEKENLD
ncbi:rod shape-determining protein MreD [uncultured Succinivibrio sp.]|uniref:rod shape-determining protein MreD n=1 Tax=uncultured Succinivibrio sp. TaxID=540749 RepID=UPI0025D5643E|nr:rod shape-determining protein MreD [uncultured Succinivibrio sp.]